MTNSEDSVTIDMVLINGMLPGRVSGPAGDLDSYWFRGFKQRVNSHLMVMVLDVYLIGF